MFINDIEALDSVTLCLERSIKNRQRRIKNGSETVLFQITPVKNGANNR